VQEKINIFLSRHDFSKKYKYLCGKFKSMKTLENSRTKKVNELNINHNSNVTSKKKKYPKSIKGCISVEEYIDIFREELKKRYEELQSTNQQKVSV